MNLIFKVGTLRPNGAWVRVKMSVCRGSIIPPTEEGPGPKCLVYKQLFDTFKSFLSLIFNLLLSVARGRLEYIITVPLSSQISKLCS